MIGLFSRLFFVSGMTVLAGGSLLFSACSTSPVQRICEDEFPRFDQRLDEALMALSPSSEGVIRQGRSIASIPEEPRAATLSEREQRKWVSWSESQLWGIQSALSSTPGIMPLERRATVRRSLNQVANMLVMFHGHADRGDPEAMVRLLERMKEHQTTARASLCQVGGQPSNVQVGSGF